MIPVVLFASAIQFALDASLVILLLKIKLKGNAYSAKVHVRPVPELRHIVRPVYLAIPKKAASVTAMFMLGLILSSICLLLMFSVTSAI